MSALKKVSECTLLARMIEPYADGELDPGHAAEMELHVVECPLCSERVALRRATRASLKRVFAAAPPAPSSFRARMRCVVTEERRRARRSAAEPWKPPIGKLAMALATVAGVIFAMSVSRTGPVEKPVFSEAGAGNVLEARIDSLLDDFVALHKHPVLPETTNPEELKRFDVEVGVPVRRPALQPFDAQFNGARLLPFKDRRAALLQYTVHGGHRVTIYVFDAHALPMIQSSSLRRRIVQEVPVYVGNRGGYSIAAAEKSGVGLALATDLDDDVSARIIAAATLSESAGLPRVAPAAMP